MNKILAHVIWKFFSFHFMKKNKKNVPTFPKKWRLVNRGRWGAFSIKLVKEEANFNVFKNKLN